jgi:hypothetical protein
LEPIEVTGLSNLDYRFGFVYPSASITDSKPSLFAFYRAGSSSSHGSIATIYGITEVDSTLSGLLHNGIPNTFTKDPLVSFSGLVQDKDVLFLLDTPRNSDHDHDPPPYGLRPSQYSHCFWAINGTPTGDSLQLYGSLTSWQVPLDSSASILRRTPIQLFNAPNSNDQTFYAVMPFDNNGAPTDFSILESDVSQLDKARLRNLVSPDANHTGRIDSMFLDPLVASGSILGYGFNPVFYPALADGSGPDLTKPILIQDATIDSTVTDPQFSSLDYQAGILHLSHPPRSGDSYNPNGAAGPVQLWGIFAALESCARGMTSSITDYKPEAMARGLQDFSYDSEVGPCVSLSGTTNGGQLDTVAQIRYRKAHSVGTWQVRSGSASHMRFNGIDFGFDSFTNPGQDPPALYEHNGQVELDLNPNWGTPFHTDAVLFSTNNPHASTNSGVGVRHVDSGTPYNHWMFFDTATHTWNYRKINETTGATVSTVMVEMASHVRYIGDGVTSFGHYNGTDQTPFLQAITDLSPPAGAPFSGPNGGGVIYILPGTYTITTNFDLHYPISFIGIGTVNINVNYVSSGTSWLKYSDDTVVYNIIAQPLEISNIHFGWGNVSGDTNHTLIDLHTSVIQFAKVSNCLFNSLRGSTSASGPSGSIITVLGNQKCNVSIDQCDFYSSPTSGQVSSIQAITITKSDGVTNTANHTLVSNCWFNTTQNNAFLNAIYCNSAHNVSIINNDFQTTCWPTGNPVGSNYDNSSAIRLYASSSIILSGNKYLYFDTASVPTTGLRFLTSYTVDNLTVARNFMPPDCDIIIGDSLTNAEFSSNIMGKFRTNFLDAGGSHPIIGVVSGDLNISIKDNTITSNIDADTPPLMFDTGTGTGATNNINIKHNTINCSPSAGTHRDVMRLTLQTTSGGSNINISYNTITASSLTHSGLTINGIFSGLSIKDNKISGPSSLLGGSFQATYGILFNATQNSADTTQVSGNTIIGFMDGIYNISTYIFRCLISKNDISQFRVGGIYLTWDDLFIISDNEVHNNTANPFTTTTIFGINTYSGGSGPSIGANRICGNKIYGMSIATTSASNYYGIYTKANVVDRNSIDFQCVSTIANNGNTYYCIFVDSADSVSNNNVNALVNFTVSPTGALYGISSPNFTAKSLVGNMISLVDSNGSNRITGYGMSLHHSLYTSILLSGNIVETTLKAGGYTFYGTGFYDCTMTGNFLHGNTCTVPGFDGGCIVGNAFTQPTTLPSPSGTTFIVANNAF